MQVRNTDCPPETKQLAQEMYLEGLGFRAIGRLLKVSHTAVYYWIKKVGQAVTLAQDNEAPIDVIEIDEMHTFVGKKNYRWIWIAVDQIGRRFLSFVCGDRSTQTGLRLWDKIKGLSVGAFTTDYWKRMRSSSCRSSMCRRKRRLIR